MSLVRQYKHWTLLLYHALRAPTIQIYMKSPSVVAGQDISGTVVIQHYQSTVFGVTVNVIGKEVNKQSHVFLKDTILQLDSIDMEHKLTLSFNYRLSDLLSGTYAHKKGSIQYYIQCIERVRVKKRFELYSNMSHYMDMDKPISFSSSHPDVSIDFYMPRTVWITDNTPIYMHLTIQNNALGHSIDEVKLRLVKRFKQHKEIIATSSSLGWWQPLEPEQQDAILMTIRPPVSNKHSTDNQLIFCIGK
ncbi:hypothetical protein RMCBS344292_12441 [Rhizopus microsporus]|nr:hypothetical protein RMCBS344292_12441 [Rhizopus microsporus]